MNPNKAVGWAWVGVIGGILMFISVFRPWLNLWGIVMATGFQIGMLALSSGDGLIIFIVGNIIFIWLFGIAGLVLLFASRFKLAMVFGMLALAFCTLDLVLYFLADMASLLSIGPFVTMAGAVMLVEGARRLSRGAAPMPAQAMTPIVPPPYTGPAPGVYSGAPSYSYQDYSNQNLYGPSAYPGQTGYDPNAPHPPPGQWQPPGTR